VCPQSFVGRHEICMGNILGDLDGERKRLHSVA
jgi:hypothetical protein